MEPPSRMFVIEAFDAGQRPREVSILEGDELARVRSYFQILPQSNRDTAAVVAFLQELRTQRRWLACGCVGELDAQRSPILYPQSVPRAILRKAILVPNYDRPAHAQDCVFARERPVRSDAPGTQPRARMSRGLGVMKALEKERGPSVRRPGSQVRETRHAKATPKIARVLFTLLEAACLNVVGHEPRNVGAAKAALKQVLETESMDGRGSKPAKNWIELGFYGADKLIEKLDAEDARTWGSLHPHGFLIDIVGDFSSSGGKHELCSVFNHTLRVEGRLSVPGENTPGPWLAICRLAKLPAESGAKAYEAYLHPTSNEDDYLLLDSDLERATLRVLKSRLWQMHKANKPYTIIKPLIDLNTTGEPGKVRPDFIVQSGSRRLVVETMGYDDQGYKDRKSVTHAQMETLQGVEKVHKHENGDDRALKTALDKFVGQ